MDKLWEVLIAAFFIPAFWFGWKWFFRIAAGAIVGKLIGGMVGSVKEKFSKIFEGETE